MRIKYRITVLFTIVVSSILLMVCVSIYYLSDINTERDFRRRLRSRALTSVNLLLKVKGIDNELLQRIDQTSASTLQNKSIVVYDEKHTELYFYTEDKSAPVRITDNSILKRITPDNDYIFYPDKRESLVFAYDYNNKRYTIVAAATDSAMNEKLLQLRFVLAISFISGVLITFISGLLFSSRFLMPIKKITREVKEISSQNLSRRIDTYGPKDELNELALTFNDLLTRLEESFAIQRRFITNASHELSTPLTSISSQLEITLHKERDVDEYKSVIFSVYEDVKNLTQLTRSLLEIAKASGTSDGMDLSLVRIDELLMRLPHDLKKTNNQYIIEMHFETFPENEEKLLVFGNIDLLYSAIKNIALNACKFSSDSTANISLNFSHEQLHIMIKNLGVISDEDQKMIFQPFYRGTTVNETNGFGLGLSLASKIIKLHKGDIMLESSASSSTVFSIHLPVARMFHNI